MTPYLHGNGNPCPACDGQGTTVRADSQFARRICKRCSGTGIVARAIRKVIRDAVRDARQQGASAR